MGSAWYLPEISLKLLCRLVQCPGFGSRGPGARQAFRKLRRHMAAGESIRGGFRSVQPENPSTWHFQEARRDLPASLVSHDAPLDDQAGTEIPRHRSGRIISALVGPQGRATDQRNSPEVSTPQLRKQA